MDSAVSFSSIFNLPNFMVHQVQKNKPLSSMVDMSVRSVPLGNMHWVILMGITIEPKIFTVAYAE
jgi:hypothetical protein